MHILSVSVRLQILQPEKPFSSVGVRERQAIDTTRRAFGYRSEGRVARKDNQIVLEFVVGAPRELKVGQPIGFLAHCDLALAWIRRHGGTTQVQLARLELHQVGRRSRTLGGAGALV